MKISAVFFISLLLSIASAQEGPIVSITSPLEGTKATAGQSLILSWINPKVPTISQIVLMRGPPTALQPVSVIAQNVNAADGSYSWKVPTDLPSGNDYALEFGTSPQLAYTGQITIQGSGAPANAAPNNASSGSAPTPSSSGGAAASTPSVTASSSGAASTGPTSANAAPTSDAATPSSSAGAAASTSSAGSSNSASPAAQGTPSASASTGTSDASRHMAGKLLIAVSAAALAFVHVF
ncbi:hypothetical protein EC973_005967 [Apophysomyces ossiformis]|uniref:Yeast cell wall synthesis Kre9/Knh1-like N-terminal domain-containing protein n=1 Tax=Apophysomyces ossiformis TaxID=679940 RepID=A0A8H7EUP7_9FUNG|nr:hypothetical protein EC973_005967 [Apophysomyces ossiformis]